MSALLIFIRNPILGEVKTRLAAAIGPEMTLRVYHKLLDCTRAAAELAAADRFVYYSNHIDPEDAWGAGLFKKRVQTGADLGARMSNAFTDALEVSGYEKAVIIGSDCPQLTGVILNQAFTALNQNDIVIGPAIDGGYYLLGMRQCHTALFTDMVWSTEHVCAETISRAESLGLKVEKLQTLTDVDELADLEAIGWF